jgi:hypothetical protein
LSENSLILNQGTSGVLVSQRRRTQLLNDLRAHTDEYGKPKNSTGKRLLSKESRNEIMVYARGWTEEPIPCTITIKEHEGKGCHVQYRFRYPWEGIGGAMGAVAGVFCYQAISQHSIMMLFIMLPILCVTIVFFGVLRNRAKNKYAPYQHEIIQFLGALAEGSLSEKTTDDG